MEENILSGGIEELKKVRSKLSELSGYRENNHILTAEEAKLNKNIINREKAINEEIIGTVRKRKEEIEDTYEEQVNETRSRIKKVLDRKEKSKNTKISERIESETAQLREEYDRLKLEGKTVLKQDQVPSFCNTGLYYALYMPKGIGDIIVIGIVLLLVLLVIPCSVYFLVLQDKGMIYLALVYFITVILFGGAYMLIDSSTKEKHGASIRKVREIRDRLAANKRKRNRIRNRILNDKDESTYGLDEYDKELQELDGGVNAILEQRKDALEVFENTTRFVIGEEIKLRHQEELNKLKAEYDRVCTEVKKTEGNITVLSMEIARNYEVYLGKEFMSVDRIDQLIETMTENHFTTVSDAIARLKQEKS